MSTTLSVLAARAKDVDAAAESLALAYEHNPWATWVIPAKNRLERLYELQRLYLRHALEHGLVLTTPQGTGAIALLPTDAPDPNDDVVDRILDLHGEHVDRLSLETPAPSLAGAWNVESLGVHPEHTRLGIGSALVVQALLRMRAIGAPTTVTTSDPRNLKFYGRYGFTTAAHRPASSTPDGAGPDVWTLHRTT
ncbi:GNAT family N-acetyltransferase [Nocardioides yefusunii]|uniref:GNAT family N-acetyltransferase n=1 Tax=Nocardioides yefusunii TaxID=2500546 RepID=A0ABW1QYJ5_9ACTN|nr:GNAT family N-acetyltransferase [Nocardioides yefusunii]